MIMTPFLRKFALTVHVISSVGFLGAVVGFLALSTAGLTSQDAQMVRAAYLGMAWIAWFVIVPLSLAALVTGILQSLGTTWGLFRYYWVLIKFLMTGASVLVLALHMRPISFLAEAVAQSTLSSTDLRQMRIQLLAAAAVALMVLIVATALSVFKPQGLTRYGWRRQQREIAATEGA